MKKTFLDCLPSKESFIIEQLDIFFSKMCNILDPTKNYFDKKHKFTDKLQLIYKYLHNPPPNPIIISQHLLPMHYIIRKDSIETIQYVRNCLVHRGGKVGKEDIKNGELKLTWYAIRDRHKRSTDKKIIRTAKYEEHSRSFKLGETIRFSPMELHRIAVFLLDEVVTVCAAMDQKFKISRKRLVIKLPKNSV